MECRAIPDSATILFLIVSRSMDKHVYQVAQSK